MFIVVSICFLAIVGALIVVSVISCSASTDTPHVISMPPKDPMDWSLTPSSGEWFTDQYCPQCKKSTTHNERMADICNGCGYNGKMSRYRSSRKIWDGHRWVVQRKYGNGPEDYTIEPM